MTTIALVDDHVMLRNGLAALLNESGHKVLLEADNGKDFLEKLNVDTLPKVVLLDVNMPQMDGYETAVWLRENYPDIKVLALSMYDDETSIIRMLRSGARGYVLKGYSKNELNAAIHSVVTTGFCYNDLVTGPLLRSVIDTGHSNTSVRLTSKEVEFLKYCCTEMTYKEIADKMFLSPRTIDGYRDELFKRLDVKSRVGLVMYAIKNGIIKL